MSEKKDNAIIVNVRECKGFNPQEHLIRIESLSSGKEELYLEVKFRVLWFLKYCDENNIFGYIDETDIIYIPEAKIFQATATVYMDGKIVAKGIAGKPFSFDDSNSSKTVIQDIATAAKGRALANAGFGTAMCAYEDSEDVPCESGIKVISNPLIPQQNNTQVTTTQKTGADTEKSVNSEFSPKKNIPSTIEEARMIKMSSGQHKGLTFGEIAAIDINFLRWIAENYNVPSHPEYPAAAKIILSNII